MSLLVLALALLGLASCGSGSTLTEEEGDTTLATPVEDSTPSAPPTDSDADGVPDDRDACPDVPEDRDGLADYDGCPETDHDEDGWLDEKDACPMDHHNGPEHPYSHGCPWLETSSETGCGNFYIPIAPGVPGRYAPTVHFAVNTLDPTDNLALLTDSIVHIVTYHLDTAPDARISIVGHVHPDEDDHETLACQRAAWMVDFLTDQGIDPTRLDTFGKWGEPSTGGIKFRGGWPESAVAFPPCHYLQYDVECPH